MLFSVSVVDADPSTLSGKVIIPGATSYYLLSDGTYWHVLGFQIRSRGFVEWLKGVQLLTPETCDCQPNDWVEGSEIEAHPIGESQEIDISDAANLESLKQCSHYLVNTKNGQILFGTPLLPVDCMNKIYHDATFLAYNQGYQAGFSASQSASSQLITNAYSQGYSAGFQAALQR